MASFFSTLPGALIGLLVFAADRNRYRPLPEGALVAPFFVTAWSRRRASRNRQTRRRLRIGPGCTAISCQSAKMVMLCEQAGAGGANTGLVKVS